LLKFIISESYISHVECLLPSYHMLISQLYADLTTKVTDK